MSEKIGYKTLKNITLMSLVILFSTLSLSFAQWEPDVRLITDDDSSYTSYNNAWCIAADGDTLHVVWYDQRDNNWEIYYKRSLDAGAVWSVIDTRLTDDPNWSYLPSVAVSGSNVHVVWEDDRDGNADVYYKRSTDGGTTWETDFRLTVDPGPQGQPSVAVSGSYVHVVWADYTQMGNSEIYYKHSTDGGTTWETQVQISNANGFSFGPSVAVSESNVHVIWPDMRHGFTNSEVYYRRSLDGGINWGPETRLTDDDNFSFDPCVAVSDSNVHVVWQDDRDANEEIYYKRNPTGNPGIEESFSVVPGINGYLKVSPNPMKEGGVIKYGVVEKRFLSLRIHDISGRIVKTFFEGARPPGSYSVSWNGRDDYDRLLSCGVYICILESDESRKTEKILLVR